MPTPTLLANVRRYTRRLRREAHKLARLIPPGLRWTGEVR